MYRLSDKLYHKPMFNVVLPQDDRVLLREPGLSTSEGKRGWAESGAQRHERAGGVNEESAIYRSVRRKPCQRACVRRPQIKCGVGGSGVWCVNCVSVHVSGIYSLNAVANGLNTLTPAVHRRNVWYHLSCSYETAPISATRSGAGVGQTGCQPATMIIAHTVRNGLVNGGPL